MTEKIELKDLNLEMGEKQVPKQFLDDNTDNDNSPTVKEYFKSWAENSACDSIPQIPRSEGWIRRIIWILIVLGLTAYTTEEVVALFQEYYSFPVNTNINYTYSNKLPFPSVTICNTNPVKKSMLAEAGDSFDSLFGTTNGVFTGRKKRSIAPETNTPPPNSGTRGQAKVSFVKEFKVKWATLGYAKRIKIGHRLKDFLVSCTLGGDNCPFFLTYSSGIFGNCFTLNSGYDGANVTSISKTGPLFGLSMELFLEDNEYLPDLNEQVAARILINDQEVMPFPENSGFNLAPGFLTTIGLKRVRISRLEGYESNCTILTQEQAEKMSIYSKRFLVKYSREACYNTCYQENVIRTCRCADPDYLFDFAFFNTLLPTNASYIRPCLSVAEEACMNRVLERYSEGQIQCDCPTPCEEIDYQTTVSISPWPSNHYLQTLRDNLKADGRQDVLNTTLDRNLLKINMFYDTLNYEHIYETAKYTELSLISDLGGILGLWLGASLFLVIQFLEMLIDMMIMCCRRLINREAKVSTSGR